MEAQQEEDDAPYQAFKPAAQQAGAFLAGGAAGAGWGMGLETSSVGWVSIGKSIVARRGDYTRNPVLRLVKLMF